MCCVLLNKIFILTVNQFRITPVPKIEVLLHMKHIYHQSIMSEKIMTKIMDFFPKHYRNRSKKHTLNQHVKKLNRIISRIN